MTSPIKIFFCYAHEDEALLKKLQTHLRTFQRQGLIELWYDRDISAGAEWEREISEQLNSAQIILLLVSPDFMASDFCYGIEMKRAMERHEVGEAQVIPIILRSTTWQEAPFGKLQALPKNAKPVTNWRGYDEAFLDIVNYFRKVISEITNGMNSSNEGHEYLPPESANFTPQNDDQVYKLIVREWVRCTDLHNWEDWSSGILSHQPTLSTERDDELIWLSGWLFGRIWPKRYPVLNEAFINFSRVLQDFYHTFHEYTETRGGIVRTTQFYKLEWNSPTYQEDLKRYQSHVELVHDLMLELTRAANYICDAVRRFIDPSFRLIEGKVLVRREFVFYETGEYFDYELILAEYKAEEHIAHLYPGLEQFKNDREERDRYRYIKW